MLNTYHYSPGGFAATAACLAGTLLYYPLTNLSTSSVSVDAIETQEISDRGSGRLTLELVQSSEDDFKIAHRGSGRVDPDRL
jgi:hypothetical protein